MYHVLYTYIDICHDGSLDTAVGRMIFSDKSHLWML